MNQNNTIPLDDDEAALFEAASTATYTPPVYTIYGQVFVKPWYCVLEKNVGKRRWVAATDKIDNRLVAVNYEIQPVIPGRKPFRKVDSSAFLAGDKEWAAIIMPAIKALGFPNAKDIDGRYICAEMVNTGRLIKDDPDKRQWQTAKPVKLFDNDQDCFEAASASRPNGPTPTGDVVTGPAVTSPLTSIAVRGISREVAIKMLPALWNASGKDPVVFLEKLKSTAVTKDLSVDDAEVLKYLMPAIEAAGEAA